jgi:hypothetical protein
MSSFTTNFFEILVPMIKGWLNNRRREKHMAVKKGYEWELVDKEIEDQFHLFPYQTTVEIDGVYGEYMEIVLLFGFLSCFGTVFPLGKPYFSPISDTILGFLLTYFTAVSELFTDKYKLIHQVKRPIPKSEFSLKIWGNILSFLSYLSIFVNTALLCYGSKSVDVFANVILGINPYYKA